MPNLRLQHIEANHLWPDFHAKFINYWQESLMESLPGAYDARIGEYISLLSDDGMLRRVGPDISVVRSPTLDYRENAATSVQTATLDHVPIQEELRWRHIEITHRPDRRLVAVLELLSPSNKSEPGRSRYLIKRNELLAQPVHLVELDLLAGGQRLSHQQPLPAAEYYALVTRADTPLKCLVVAWSGDGGLPSIAIPLLPPDQDLICHLQPIFDIAFQKGRYR